jgi:serine/threonine-protein kinase
MIAKLRHPGIVAIHAAGEATGIFYYVMNYVPGESLRQRLTREGALPPAAVASIVADLADALHAAGQAGLVHRDVKPENVLLDSATGQPLLADFGIARAMAAEGGGTVTAQGVAVGTPTYMSPEQAAGETVDHRSDLYALGVVAYEMVAGRPPFQGVNAAAVASMHLAERPTPLETLRPETPAGLAQAIMRALEKDPVRRWQTGAEFRDAVLAAGQGTRAEVRPARPRRWLPFVAAAALLVGLFTVVSLRSAGPPHGVNPRHSILVLPFVNVRGDPAVDWLRDGSVNMLTLNLSQWTDLNVVDHERLHDLLERRRLAAGDPIGLDMARRLARDAGVWTVVLGDFVKGGDSLHLVARVYDVASGRRLDVAQVDARPGDDVRPMFDQLAAELLNISGAPSGLATDLTRATTPSLEAYRSYLRGIDALNRWDLATAENQLRSAVGIDSAFGLAYYKLSLTRGWIAGQKDSLGALAIQRATQFSARLPEHDRTMVEAYRAFVDGDYAAGRATYQRLLQKDSTDADAWYGLGDVTFHDTSKVEWAANWTRSLRAFKRSLALDPGYYLAYEHLAQIYNTASQSDGPLALLPGDSLALVKRGTGRLGVDSVVLVRSVQRARDSGLAMARTWVANQPDNAHAQNAVLSAQAVRGDFQGALNSIEQFLRPGATTRRPDLPFVKARLQAAMGDFTEATRSITRALRSSQPADFDPAQLPAGEAINDVSSAANLLVFTGQIGLAQQTLDFAARIRAGWHPDAPWAREVGGRPLFGDLLLSNLFASVGVPEQLKPIWAAVAEEARKTPKSQRSALADYGWSAAIGLFLANPSDPTPLNELIALGDGEPPAEIRAIRALARGDSAEARRLLLVPDSVAITQSYRFRGAWEGFRVPIAAGLWLALGEPDRTLRILEPLKPKNEWLGTQRFFGVEWGLIGQVRLLRGAALERLRRPADAAREYREVLAQWEHGDPVVEPWLREARMGLSRVEHQG